MYVEFPLSSLIKVHLIFSYLAPRRSSIWDLSGLSATDSSSVAQPQISKNHARSRSVRSSDANPRDILGKRDTTQFMEFLKGVAVKADGAAVQAGKSSNTKKIASTKVDKKRQKDSRRISAPTGILSTTKEKGKGKEKEHVGTDPQSILFSRNHRSLPDLIPSAVASTSMVHDDISEDVGMSFDTAPCSDVTFSMDVDYDTLSEPSRPELPTQILMPPPPLPYSKLPSPSPNTPLNPTPKLHPVLQHKHPTAPTKPRPPPPLPATAQPMVKPTLSATRGPPALGMRRAHTLPTPNSSQSPGMPTRQKPFKPPLLSQPQQPPPPQQLQPRPPIQLLPVPTQPARVFPTPCPSQRHLEKENAVRQPQRQPSPLKEAHPPSDPDSSFGDISFDKDALDELMQQYD